MKGYILFAFVFALGWLGLVSGACDHCNPHGVRTATPKCDPNGICHCKSGYTDSNCYTCAPGNYWRNGDECIGLQTYPPRIQVQHIQHTGKCAFNQKTLEHKHAESLYTYEDVKSMEECKLLCKQWANCDYYILNYKNLQKMSCLLLGRKAFQNEDSSNSVISGYQDCPRSDRCIENDKLYDTKYNLKKISNVSDPYKCQEFCEDEQNCRFYSYSIGATNDFKTCYLKNETLGRIMTDIDKDGLKEAANFVSGAVECNYCKLFFHIRMIKIIQNILD